MQNGIVLEKPLRQDRDIVVVVPSLRTEVPFGFTVTVSNRDEYHHPTTAASQPKPVTSVARYSNDAVQKAVLLQPRWSPPLARDGLCKSSLLGGSLG